jgi:hypothetical protein
MTRNIDYQSASMDAELKPVIYVTDALVKPNLEGTRSLFTMKLCPLCTAAMQLRLAIANRMVLRVADMPAEDINAIVYCLCEYITVLGKRRQSNDCNCVGYLTFAWDTQPVPTVAADVNYKLVQNPAFSFELTCCRLLLAQILFVSAHRSAMSSDYKNCTLMIVHAIGVIRVAEQAAAADGQTKTVTAHFLNSMRNYISGYMLTTIIRTKIANSSSDKQALEILQALAERAVQLFQLSTQALTNNKILERGDKLLSICQWCAVKACVLQMYFASRRLYIPMSEWKGGTSAGLSMPNECGMAVAVLKEAAGRAEKFTHWATSFPPTIKEDAAASLTRLQQLLKQCVDDNTNVKGDTIPAFTESLMPTANPALIERVTQTLDAGENLTKLQTAFSTAAPTSLPTYIPNNTSTSSSSTPVPSSLLTPSLMDIPLRPAAGIVSTMPNLQMPTPKPVSAFDSTATAHPTPSPAIVPHDQSVAFTKSFLASILRRLSFPVAFTLSEGEFQTVRNEERAYILKWSANIDSTVEQLFALKTQVSNLSYTYTGRDDMIYAYNMACLLDESVLKEAQQCKARIRLYAETPMSYYVNEAANNYHAMFMLLESGHLEVFSELLQLYNKSTANSQTLLDEISLGLSNVLKAVEFYRQFLSTITTLPTYASSSQTH